MSSGSVGAVIGAIVGAAIGAAATIATGAFGYLNKDRELDIRMVDIGLSILSGENRGTDAEPGRRFALRLLEKYSQTVIPTEEFDTWATKGTLEVPLLALAVAERQTLSGSIEDLEARATDLRFAIGRQSQGVDGLAGRTQEYYTLRRQVMDILAEKSALERRMKALNDVLEAFEPNPAGE